MARDDATAAPTSPVTEVEPENKIPKKTNLRSLDKENHAGKEEYKADRLNKGSSLPYFQPNCDATILLTLFKNQQLTASGHAYYKAGMLQPPKRYFVELRGSTMVMFRNTQVARATSILMRDIIAVLVLKLYKVTVVKRQGQSPRIFVHGPGLEQGQVLYIKAASADDLEVWRQALAIAETLRLPDLMSMTIETVIGQGGGGKVFLVFNKADNQNYALKVIDKRHTFASANAMKHVISERNLMQIVGEHPFVLQMQFAFQTDYNLYIGTPFCGGGDLATYLKNHAKKRGSQSPEHAAQRFADGERRTHQSPRPRYGGHLSEARARLIAAEVLLALEHLHSRGIVYRDLKPENIFIDDSGHLKLGDFGLSKHLQPSRVGNGFIRTASICGTRNYLPPEMLLGHLYGFEVDMWSYGVMLFRILCGRFPFDASRTKEVFQIVKRDAVCMPDFFSDDAKALIYGLLTKDQAKRLTVAAVKNHSFFEGVDWAAMMAGQTPPPITDLELGQSADVLDNFEISKLQGITVGEYIPPDASASGADHGPQGRMDPDGRIIGFEYAALDSNAPCPPPLEIQSKNVISPTLKVRSFDADVSEKVRALGSFRNMRSPRGIKPLKTKFPDRVDEEDEDGIWGR